MKISASRKEYIKFSIWSILYILLIIWFEYYFLLTGLLFLADYFLFHIIPWRKLNGIINIPERFTSSLEWTKAILVAFLLTMSFKILFLEAYKIPTPSMEKTLLVGDYLFVSKIGYGPKLPNTPFSIPFLPNMLPNGRRTYSMHKELPYKRLKGFSKVKHNDIIVFNFPEGDTVVTQYPGQNYYSLVRQYGRDYIFSRFEVIYHPVDKRDNYIKRCVGLPGDTIQIRDGQVFTNGLAIKKYATQQFNYYVRTFGERLSDDILKKAGIKAEGTNYNPNSSLYIMPLSIKDAEFIRGLPEVKSIQPYVEPIISFKQTEVFPHAHQINWTVDEFGPLVIPYKGLRIELSERNILLYDRLIRVYEKNNLKIIDNKIYLNGKITRFYTFDMNYYFVLGDNRHNSADSRFWGLVPEDHLVGKAVLIWFSKDPEKNIFRGLRLKRMFKSIK
jgi:signal peptidase I